jgi:hypothetical protein
MNRDTIRKRAMEQPEDSLEVFQEAFRILVEKKKNTQFHFPKWLRYVAGSVPLDQVRVRRDWGRFVQFLEAIAVCRKFSDEDQDSTTIEITFPDYCVAYHLLNSVFSSTLQGVREQELEIAKAVRRIFDEKRLPVPIDEIAKDLGWQQPKVYKYIHDAATHNLIRFDPGTKPKNRKLVLPGLLNAQDFVPSPSQVFNANEELGEMVSYVDPISGLTPRLTRKRRPSND